MCLNMMGDGNAISQTRRRTRTIGVAQRKKKKKKKEVEVVCANRGGVERKIKRRLLSLGLR